MQVLACLKSNFTNNASFSNTYTHKYSQLLSLRKDLHRFLACLYVIQSFSMSKNLRRGIKEGFRMRIMMVLRMYFRIVQNVLILNVCEMRYVKGIA